MDYYLSRAEDKKILSDAKELSGKMRNLLLKKIKKEDAEYCAEILSGVYETSARIHTYLAKFSGEKNIKSENTTDFSSALKVELLHLQVNIGACNKVLEVIEKNSY